MEPSKKRRRVESKKLKLQALMQFTSVECLATKSKKQKTNEDVVTYDVSNGSTKHDEACLTDDSSITSSVKNGDRGSGNVAKQLSDDELAALRAALRAKQKAAMQAPKLYLTLDKMNIATKDGTPVQQQQASDGQPTLFLLDLQQLLLHAVQGVTASYKPRWCTLLRSERISRTALFVLDDVSSSDYNQFSDCFPFLKEKFAHSVTMVNPVQFGRTLAEELFRVPVSNRLLKMASKTGEAFPLCKAPSVQSPSGMHLRDGEVISRLDLLLNVEQMIMENYPLPVIHSERLKDFVFSREEYKEASNASPLFGLDCEMCLTTSGRSELTRVALTNEDGKCILDVLVKPRNAITNYLTQYSGITKAMLENVSVRIESAQKFIRDLLPPDAILVGQSLNSDLHALKMFHPYVIDTSLIYNITGIRGHKTKLKVLTSMFLKRDIQMGGKSGHNPCEDALAALELVQLKLKNGLEFGDVILGGPIMNSVGHRTSAAVTTSKTVNQPVSNVHQPIVPSAAKTLSAESAFKHLPVSCSPSVGRLSGSVASSNETEQATKVASQKDRKNFFNVASSSMHYRDFFEIARKENKSASVAFQSKSKVQQIKSISFVSEKEADALRKLDKRIRKVMKSVESRALVAVVLAGDYEMNSDAMCFVTIT